MSDKSLHIEVKPAGGQAYSENHLQLQKAGPIRVSVKEYLEAKAVIDRKVKAKQDENQAEYKKAVALYEKKAAGGWTPQEIESQNANVAARERTDKRIKAEIAALGKDKDALDQTYSDLRWVWQLAGSGLDKATLSFSEGLGKGITNNLALTGDRTLQFPPLLEGGGLVWLEPFHEAEKPVGEVPHGCFISALGTAKIIDTLWTDADNKPISGTVAFGSGVLLHIYTAGLYGQELDIELIDHDIFSPDDKLTITNDASVSNKAAFTREVDVTQVKSFENKATYTRGGLEKTEQNKTDGKAEGLVYIQKTVVEVFVSPAWLEEAGSTLKIYPVIKSLKTKKYFEDFPRKYLNVAENGTKVTPNKITSNNPLVTGNIEVDPDAFHPCKYTEVKGVVYRGSETIQEVSIFNEKDIHNKMAELLEFPIVAGVNKAIASLVVQLDPVTDECRYIKEPKIFHKGHVINLAAIAYLLRDGRGKASGQYRTYDTEDVLKELGIPLKKEEKKDAKPTYSPDKKDTSLSGINKIKETLSIKSEGTDIKIQSAYKILEKYTPFVFEASDQKFNMQVAYDYSHGNRVDPLIGLVAALWPTNPAIVQRYPVVLDTCRYSKPMNILVYPDVKWVFQLAFNYDGKRFKEVKEAYHDDYKVKEMMAEQDKKRLQRQKMGTAEGVRKRVAAQDAIIRDARNKTGWSGMTQKHYELLNPQNALLEGIIDCKGALVCEFDRPYESMEVSSAFPKLTAFFKKLAEIKAKIDKIINGEDEDANKKAPKEDKKRMANMRKKLEDMKKAGKKESAWSFEFKPPSVAWSIGWYAEHPPDVNTPAMGMMIEGIMKAEPLMGFEVKYDIFNLLGKIPHPAVKAVVLFIEALDYALGDNFDIDLDMVVSGELTAEGQGRMSTVAESTYSNRLKADKESPFKIEGKIEISFKALIKGSAEVGNFLFGKYEAYGSVEGEVKSGISCEGNAKAFNDGLYLEPTIKFLGVTMKFDAKGGLAFSPPTGDDKKSPESRDGVHYTASGEVIVMDAYDWPLTDWKIPLFKS